MHFSNKSWKAGERPGLFPSVPVCSSLLLTFSPKHKNYLPEALPLPGSEGLPFQAPARTREVIPGSGKHLLPHRGSPQCAGKAARRKHLRHVRSRARPLVPYPRESEGVCVTRGCVCAGSPIRRPTREPGAMSVPKTISLTTGALRSWSQRQTLMYRCPISAFNWCPLGQATREQPELSWPALPACKVTNK